MGKNIIKLCVAAAVVLFVSSCASAPHPVIPSRASLFSDRESLELVFAQGDDALHVQKNLILPAEGAGGSAIVWNSSDEELIKTNGNVTPSVDRHRNVVLTANLSQGTETRSKKFYVRVLRKPVSLPEGHPVVLDGAIGGDEWDPAERFSSSTDDTNYWISWDKDYLYLAIQSPFVDKNGPQAGTSWFVAYIGYNSVPSPGEKTYRQGQFFRTQSYELPFDAFISFKWRPSDGYFLSATPQILAPRNNWEWGYLTSSTSPEYNPLDLNISGVKSGNGSTVEFRISRDRLGSPDSINLCAFLLNENPAETKTWGLLPAEAGKDGVAEPLKLKAYYTLDLRSEPPSQKSRVQPVRLKMTQNK